MAESYEDAGNMEDVGEMGDVGMEEVPLTLPAWKSFLFSKWGCAVLLSTLTILLMLIIRPSFILRRRRDILSKPQINWITVIILWAALFVAIIAVPAIIAVCKKKWVGKDGTKEVNAPVPSSPIPSPIPSPLPVS
jgi:hypothetical protein